MYSPAKKYRYAGAPTSIPYTGQKRWHMIFGLVFGLGAATKIDSVEIRWPSGLTETFAKVSIDKFNELKEGTGTAVK